MSKPISNTSQHTPGPWTVEQRAGNSLSIDGPTGREIASVYDEDIDEITPEQEANASLIAAAPDLLAALTTFIASTEHLRHVDRLAADGYMGAAEKAARAAIAKAQG